MQRYSCGTQWCDGAMNNMMNEKNRHSFQQDPPRRSRKVLERRSTAELGAGEVGGAGAGDVGGAGAAAAAGGAPAAQGEPHPVPGRSALLGAAAGSTAAIFKPFDSKTGQFVSAPPAAAGASAPASASVSASQLSGGARFLRRDDHPMFVSPTSKTSFASRPFSVAASDPAARRPGRDADDDMHMDIDDSDSNSDPNTSAYQARLEYLSEHPALLLEENMSTDCSSSTSSITHDSMVNQTPSITTSGSINHRSPAPPPFAVGYGTSTKTLAPNDPFISHHQEKLLKVLTQNATGSNASSQNKLRANSVPTILHSSLRRLTASHLGQVQARAPKTPESYNRNQFKPKKQNEAASNVGGHSHNPGSKICKKKSPKAVTYLISAASESTDDFSVPMGSRDSDNRTDITSAESLEHSSGRDYQPFNNNIISKKKIALLSKHNQDSPSSLRQNPSIYNSADLTNNDTNGEGNRNDSDPWSTRTSGANRISSSYLRPDASLEERIEYLKLNIPETKGNNSATVFPPINLQGLKEIDLQEILKNPQLRHDIIFDPLLQFRPNLDGERGLKKRQLSDKYWNDVENEIFVCIQRPDLFRYEQSRLVPLFETLREVLLTIVPPKEASTINSVLDTEMNIRGLLKGSLIMSNLSEWLSQLFKNHCAPMRDPMVDKMSNIFEQAETENSLPKSIEGLRLVFQILETMKLDIANHQIRILRPALLSNAIEFEKQYLKSLLNSRRIDLNTSLTWFNNRFDEYSSNSGDIDKNYITVVDVHRLSVKSVISLLSCRRMVRSFPSSLSFDHTRLILLRADIRQIICLLVCRLLFQQLVSNDVTMEKPLKEFVLAQYPLQKLKTDITSIITDEHGNCRWTKNTVSVAIHLCKVISELKLQYKTQIPGDTEEARADGTNGSRFLPVTMPLDDAEINFAKSWLSKQTQPLSEVYAVLEGRVLKRLEDEIVENSNCTKDGHVKQDFIYFYSNAVNNGTGVDANGSTTTWKSGVPASVAKQQTSSSGVKGLFNTAELEEYDNVFRHLYTVVNLHWSVYGEYYLDSLGDKIKRKGI